MGAHTVSEDASCKEQYTEWNREYYRIIVIFAKLPVSLKSMLSCEWSSVLFLSMYLPSHFCPFSLSLSADPTVQSDMQLLPFL